MSDVGVLVHEQCDLEEPVALPHVRGLGWYGVNRVVYFVCWCGRSGSVRFSAGLLLPGMCCTLIFRFSMWSCR